MPQSITSKSIPKRDREEFEDSDSDSSSNASGEMHGGSSQDSVSDEKEVDNHDEDADAPRIVQWDGDDDLVYKQDEDGLSVKPSSSKLPDLENSLKSLPLGTLRTAQSKLYEAESDKESHSDSDDSGSEASGRIRNVKRENVKWISKETRKKRPNKNAPMEVTSKKPVTRKRTVVDVPKIVERDPRFLPLAGDFKPEVFQKSYGFLVDSHKTELQTLRETLERARKLLSSSPRDQLAEREAEVERLEWAIKRTESLVNKDRQDAIQRDASVRARDAEKERRKEGKRDWWMKKGEKREIFHRARFEAIAAEGGGRAVKKAIDKKQKKISQKEKKTRPYARGKAFEPPHKRPRRH